jgi:hypothetical protein
MGTPRMVSDQWKTDSMNDKRIFLGDETLTTLKLERL